jgi:outer membrane protein OmpA-like peptidoglycan-associated protein
MSGDSLSRHCSECDRPVHNLSAMTEAEVGALLLRSGSRVCVRFQHDGADIVFERAARQPPAPSARPAANIVAALAVGVAACSPAPAIHPSAAVDAPDAARSAPVTTEASRDASPPAAAREDDAGAMVAQSCVPAEHPQKASKRVVVVQSTQGITILQLIQFARGAHTLDARSREIVEASAKVLHDVPAIEKVAIIGHASSDERDALKISELRAREVVRALVALGVDPARLVAQAQGSKEPLESNATQRGRAKNRRTEFKILSERREGKEVQAGSEIK